nr:DNA-directed RNA polymerase subunit delta [Brevibacillus sp. SYP-B805]
MALVDIAYEILKETNRPYNFRELMDEIAALRNLSEQEKMGMIAQVYTEVNIDGRFVCIGENTWGLKRWYPTETVEETQEGGKKKKLVLDDDFDDDYELEEELVEEYEEDDELAVFEDDEFVDPDDLDDLGEDLVEDDPELLEDEEIFEDEELVEEEEEVIEEEPDDENEDF